MLNEASSAKSFETQLYPWFFFSREEMAIFMVTTTTDSFITQCQWNEARATKSDHILVLISAFLCCSVFTNWFLRSQVPIDSNIEWINKNLPIGTIRHYIATSQTHGFIEKMNLLFFYNKFLVLAFWYFKLLNSSNTKETLSLTPPWYKTWWNP